MFKIKGSSQRPAAHSVKNEIHLSIGRYVATPALVTDYAYGLQQCVGTKLVQNL